MVDSRANWAIICACVSASDKEPTAAEGRSPEGPACTGLGLGVGAADLVKEACGQKTK